MYYMFSMSNDFAAWLNAEVDERSWTFRELGRRSGLSVAAISDVANEKANPGFKFCVQVGRALGHPPENVLRRAGLLPSLPPAVEEERELVGILRALPAGVRSTVVVMVRSLAREQAGGNAPVVQAAVAEELAGYGSREVSEMDDLDEVAEELKQIWRRLRYMDPQAAENLMQIAKSQADMVMHAAKAAQRLEEQGEREQEQSVASG